MDSAHKIPEFKSVMGHPSPLWMLFMTEFWERFAFYGIRWALVLYVVAQFYAGDSAGQAHAGLLYGSFLALIYGVVVFGGYVADHHIGYQRAILMGAVFMAAGFFALAVPDEGVFRLGLALIIVGSGLFKPNISTIVGHLYDIHDQRRDSGFTIFYMGINAGALIAPVLTGILAEAFMGDSGVPSYKIVFLAAGIGMLISLAWFWFLRADLKGVGTMPLDYKNLFGVLAGSVIAVPAMYMLLSAGSFVLQIILTVLFVGVMAVLLIDSVKHGSIQRDRIIALAIIFFFNVAFWCFFEQAGSSFTFLAENIVDRDFSGWIFPVGWFQSINPISVVILAPLMALMWVKMGSKNPSIPRKFGIGLILNAFSFALLVFAFSALLSGDGKIPLIILVLVYIIQTMGELCLSPIGLSMVTKLASKNLAGTAMGGWFLSIAIGNNLAGIYASFISGDGGMTADSAYSGYMIGFFVLFISGAVLFVIAPFIQRLMHGVR